MWNDKQKAGMYGGAERTEIFIACRVSSEFPSISRLNDSNLGRKEC